MDLYLTFFRDSRVRLSVGLGLNIAQAMPLLPIPLLLRYAFDTVIPARSLSGLLGVGAAVIVLQCLSAWLSVRGRTITVAVIKHAIFGLREALMAKRYALPRSVYLETAPATFHDLLVHDTERVDAMTAAVLTNLVPAAVLTLCVGAILCWINWQLALTTVVLMPVAAAVSHWTRRRFRSSVRAFHGAFERFNRATLVALEATDLTNIEAADQTEIARQSRAMDAVRAAGTEMGAQQSAAVTTHGTATGIMGGVVLVVGGVLLSRGLTTLGALMSFYVALALLRNIAGNALVTLPQVVEGWDALRRVMSSLQQDAPPVYHGTQAAHLRGRVRLESVRFGYDERRPVLRELDLELAAGAMIAISGESGVGKTTLAMLLLGLYRPQSGHVVFDDDRLDDLDVRQVRRQIGVLPQDPLILPGTVSENIAFGLDANQTGADRIREAAVLADAHGFVSALPSGYETVLGSRGTTLSGGQRQRIALARALVKRPRILILDEPTNHLGSSTVKAVLASVARWEAPPAVLIISHDPVLLAEIPRVFRLDQGRLALVPTPSRPQSAGNIVSVH